MYSTVRKKVLFSMACLFLSATIFPASAAMPTGKFAPLNPAFVEYRDALERGEKTPTGAIESPIDLSYLKNAKVDPSFFENPARQSALSSTAIPEAFDLAAEGRVTPVLDQGGWGTCWAFATMESVESSLLSATGKTYDLSELNLAWFAYSDEDSTKPAFTPYTPPDPAKENPIFNNGGTSSHPIALFARGTGPLFDSDAPYPNMDKGDPGWKTFIPDPLPYGPARFRLKEALLFTDVRDIKRALMSHGGMYIRFIVTRKYMDSNTGAIYTPEDGDINLTGGHAVMLVGWDDNYPKGNFKNEDGKQPANNGAWRIQNSWGTNAGDKGYFWISYEDATVLKSGATSYIMEPVESYDGIYFHDPLGACRNLPIPDAPEACIANAFVATRDEKIVEVSFMTGNVNLKYAIQIHRNLDSGKNPGTGEPIFATPQTGTTGATGYYSVRLDDPVSIKKGERFAVEVRLAMTETSTPSGKFVLPVEAAVKRYSEKATACPGESWSFNEDDESWTDMYYKMSSDEDDESPFNFCIKAFTTADSKSNSGGGGCAAGSLGLAGFVLVVALAGGRRKAA